MEFKNELQILHNCFACLRHSEDSLQILCDTTSVLNSVTVVALLTKYFWFHHDDFNADHVLCRKCLNRLDEFHRFYLEVERNHCSLNLATPEVGNYEVKQERKEEPLDALGATEPAQMAVKVENLDEFEEEASDEETKADDCLSDEEHSDKNESEPEEIKPKRKYTKRIKTEAPVVKRKANYQVKDAKQLAEEDDIIKTHVQYICEACGSNCPTFTQLQKHMTNVHGMKGCITCCGTRYHKKVRLLEHVQKLQDPDRFKCDVCHKSFVNNHGIQRHKQEMHVPDELKIFHCDRCPKRFAKESQLAFHLKGHDNLDNETAKCLSCERVFQTESQLKVHVKIRHTRPTDYICDVCAKGFYSKTEFLRHKKLHELRPEDLRVQCDICHQWLKNKLSWRKHYRRHNQGPSACDICGHVSPNAVALARHKRYLHRTEPSFACQDCGKQFKRAIGLREHMASHTGEALYTCSFCDKTFNSNANMFSHRKKMHPREWLEQKNAQLAAQQGVTAAGSLQ
ncbi:transcription factor grauzone-like [Ochlerotatus camptorhynchus]|uniref:transcription factor grauzone-like n=1 Tax=Ochlerotatus camptorhynchus TaxID=644619 RepID=UPI0031CEE9FA